MYSKIELTRSLHFHPCRRLTRINLPVISSAEIALLMHVASLSKFLSSVQVSLP
ncbi:hypothetical protein [Funiculus sociatus]|uniref:hypothetical protein n=1 Tax=Funiculus sociatus TaxID=450527 RepID=UPI0019B16A6C|nr:hypothetical protein [Trichocoleus sp. FACHB-40]